MGEITSWCSVWDSEFNARKSTKPEEICTFGIKPLDDALGGLLKTDLCVIGADSGIGKTELSIGIAMHNAQAGRKVVLYSLEGGAKQAISRIKWNRIIQTYYAKYKNGTDMDMRDWLMNKQDNKSMFNEIEAECQNELVESIGLINLSLYDSEAAPTLKDFCSSLDGYLQELPMRIDTKYNVDLIIIDHLQYFSLTGNNEYAETTEILKKIKDIPNHYNIPVILVSHLRKKEKDRGIPGQEDFHGTSNIAKVASLAITLAPCPVGEDYGHGIYPTWFRVCKNRTGRMGNLAMKCNFNTKVNQYDQHYDVFTLCMDNPKEQLLGDRLPKWARIYDDINQSIVREIKHGNS